VAASVEGRKRFEREARATSALNHPHICTLHDVGEHEGVEFLVMEVTEGETLADHLRRGALPMSDALEYAAQMADALAAAHRHGIVHRDLKPANVMLTAHGVKLLDFGLAALRPTGFEGSGVPQGSTAAGTILGTLQYMAPEQLEGKPVDGRADIFAIGAILYEMLTGRKAFRAGSSAGVVAAVLNDMPPPLTAERPEAPAPLDWLVRQCLAKVADERWQSAADLARHLRWIEASHRSGEARPVLRPARRRTTAWFAAVLGIAAVATVYWWAQREQPGTPLPYRFEIAPPAGTSYEGLFAISPDGRRVAFTATDAAGVRSLWIRPLEGLTAQRIGSTDGALHPFWSPDGGSVGFFADRKLKTVDLRTGTVRILSDTGTGAGGTWNRDGVILFADESTAIAPRSPARLRRVSASGGVATMATRVAQDAGAIQAYPHFLPDGRHYLYTQLGVSDPGIHVGRLDDDETRRILPALVTSIGPQHITIHGPVRAIYAAGHLFSLDNNDLALTARAFDVERLQLTGDAVRVAEDVEHRAPGLAAYDVSATGALIYRPLPPLSGHVRQLTWFDRAGREAGRLGDAGPYQNAALSSDGRSLLIERLAGRPGGSTIVQVDVTSGTSSPFTQGQFPIGSPDGKWLAYSGGAGTFARVTAAGKSTGGELLLRPPVHSWAGDWSTDGQHVVGTALRHDTGYDIFATVVGSGVASYPVASHLDETDPRLSPDRRWLAHAAADESRRWDVYVRPFDGSGAAVRVSRGGGRHPHWSDDGRELFYVAPDGTLMRAAVDRRPTFTVSNSVALFRRAELGAGFNNVMTGPPYVPAPDGERFLVPVAPESPAPAPVIVLTNWPSLVEP
jgi:Tol biopolymer transport system component